MGLRYIDNLTILARVGEDITLPSTLIARQDDGSFITVSVTWNPSTVDTSTEGEFIFEGTVSGYAYKVLCSVQVGEMEHNPASSFPEELDQFGMPKQDIQTVDIPDIDDYQYFKAKIPRTVTEETQLKQLRELLADKIILARDINHLRNAAIAIEEYCFDLQDQINLLEQRVTDLEGRMDSAEDRITILENETIVDGVNLGSGAEVFRRKNNRELEFRTLVSKEPEKIATIDEESREISIGVDTTRFPVPMGIKNGTQYLKFKSTFNWQMIKVKIDSQNSGYYESLLWVLGMGENTDGVYAARMLKSVNSFIIEMKLANDRFAGFIIDSGGARTFNETYSFINEQSHEGLDVYSDNVYIS